MSVAARRFGDHIDPSAVRRSGLRIAAASAAVFVVALATILLNWWFR